MDYFGERLESFGLSPTVSPSSSDNAPPLEIRRSQKQRLIWSKPLHQRFKMAVKKLGSRGEFAAFHPVFGGLILCDLIKHLFTYNLSFLISCPKINFERDECSRFDS
jgi:hypothetical protein